MEDTRLELFTARQIHQWLLTGKSERGLSEAIIAPSRAWAIVNNPYVKDDDDIIATIFVNNEPAAFTAAFPEWYDNKRIWWFSTLWCNPAYRGKGYGLVVVGSLAESYGYGHYYDRFAPAETIEICKHLNLKTIYSYRYYYGDDSVSANTIRGKAAFVKRSIYKWWYNKRTDRLNDLLPIQYITWIDEETYDFIRTHSDKNAMLHTQEMLNWILKYPFVQSCPLINYVTKKAEFASITIVYNYYTVRLRNIQGDIAGVYVIRHKDDDISILYLYYDEDYVLDVFKSIERHLHFFKPISFQTECEALASYIDNHYYFPTKRVDRISFSYPENEKNNHEWTFQMGDGDSFV